jgi:hypothetical protein
MTSEETATAPLTSLSPDESRLFETWRGTCFEAVSLVLNLPLSLQERDLIPALSALPPDMPRDPRQREATLLCGQVVTNLAADLKQLLGPSTFDEDSFLQTRAFHLTPEVFVYRLVALTQKDPAPNFVALPQETLPTATMLEDFLSPLVENDPLAPDMRARLWAALEENTADRARRFVYEATTALAKGQTYAEAVAAARRTLAPPSRAVRPQALIPCAPCVNALQ